MGEASSTPGGPPGRDDAALVAARAALIELRENGSPVVGHENVDEILTISARRWRSYERRHSTHPGHLDTRIEDLAKGLRDHFEEQPGLTGPIMEDYRFLASVLAAHMPRL
ncbi:hypothetical protein [Aeromicrobium ginsengisoli]|uniref:Uncharacterized protein n=1 Tax=Aeromicrobium ginsengisoli TaxID=363867 RepID=A0A5M4FGX6_9ACTN|nr:hypothetical protein [Aeromicrobium ginsengisoli]KAA1399414.1 hypothetical protein ESP70_001170 [Aeromicrobium ginsengisoli]